MKVKTFFVLTQVESLLLVVVHSSQLGTMRREFERLMESSVEMVAEQTSCHRAIAESLSELKVLVSNVVYQILLNSHKITAS